LYFNLFTKKEAQEFDFEQIAIRIPYPTAVDRTSWVVEKSPMFEQEEPDDDTSVDI
jgi:hypothetical protein